ncbi:MAG: ATP-binding protein [Geobacteraceae bacterium]
MKDPLGKNNFQASWLLAAGIFLSLLLVWFAEVQYRQALPVAEENLRGLSLSLSAAVEALIARDPTLLALKNFTTPDLAYFALLDRSGTILYHSNNNLNGSRVTDQRFAPVFTAAETFAVRRKLGTGEEIYEANLPVHSNGRVMALRLALHTYRSDAVIRRAQADMLVVFSLLATAWVMGLLLYRSARRAEAHRQEMSRRERFAQLGEMGAALAHEIRNPLSGIKGYAQLLLEDPRHPGEGAPAAMIVEESLRLERLVNDLLSYVRTRPVPLTPVRVAEVLRCCLAMVAYDAEKQTVRLTSDLRDELLATGDRDELEQVFLNLVRNALQAMPEGGTLLVRMQQGKGVVVIEVRDTGHGVPVEDWSRIFTPFMTTRARGTGLGLAITRKIVEEWGGSIRVADSSSRGTTIELTLPLYGKG